MSIRRNRIVKPFRGKLYDMVVKNFAHVPVLNAKGRKVREKGKVKKVRKKEVTDAFEIYYNLCLADEYFKMIYEERLKGNNTLMSTLEKDFSASWRYLIRKYAANAPRGMRELATKLEGKLKDVDKNINEGLAGVLMGMDINMVMGGLKKATSSTDFKKTISWYADFIKQAFAMLGFNVVGTVKSNPKFNIRYVQFSVGDDISELISQSSSVIAGEIEKAAKLKKIRDTKLKSDLLKQGYLVDSEPVLISKGRNKGMVYLTVAYDPQVSNIPKPRSKPKTPKFTKKEKELVFNLDNLVQEHTVYDSNIIPRELFFTPPKCSIVRDENTGKPRLVYETGESSKNENIISQTKILIDRISKLAVPKYREGYGKLPSGEPEAGYNSRGNPIYRYEVPKAILNKYSQAIRVFQKVLQLRAVCDNTALYSQEMYDYKEARKPFIKGVYSSDFTDELGNTYQRFDNMEELAKKVLKERKKKRLEKLLEPKIEEEVITVDNYPDWDGKKVVYTTRKVKVAKFKYSEDASYNPVQYTELLQEALNRINLGRNPNLDPSLQDKVLTPKFREIKGSGGFTKSFQLVSLKDSEGKVREIIVSGRYAGYELDTILNMEGRFLEGGYYSKDPQTGRTIKKPTERISFDERGNVSTLDKVKDGDSWTYKQRLIEPYITVNPKTGILTLGIPGENSNKIDRKIMRDLSQKIASITEVKNPKLPKYHQGRNPFWTFGPEDFEVIREALGSVAMSASATKYMDEYYGQLRAKESAMAVENTDRFNSDALGGFISKLPNGKPFNFNNKQKEAAAWLEASDMRGVVALDTGVGKTLTSLVAIKKAINEGMEKGGKEAKRRFLFVSPKSLVGNLKKEVRDFMSTGGEEFVRADGEVEKTPNWRRIVLNRIDEMSYEDFVETFKKAEGIDELVSEMDRGEELTLEVQRKARENKHRGKQATITYEVGYKNGTEIWRKEVDFQIGNLIDPTIVRTGSVQEDEVRTIQELVSYPDLTPEEKSVKDKELAKSRRQLNKLKKEAKAKSSPVVNKYFEDKYYACFFDEINEIFGKGGSSKNYAVSSLGHPRKIFLTASALDRDPVDLYRLSTLAKGKQSTRKSEKAFAEKYGVVLAGRMVALKPDPQVREQFYNWVKENAYFAPKMDISENSEFGVNYQEVNLPQLKSLQSRTITTQMPKDIQKKYKKEAKKISGELKAMVAKYRDLRSELAEQTDRTGDFFDRRKSKAYQDLTKATGDIKKALSELIKISSEGMFKADVASRVFKDSRGEKCLYFCSSKTLARSVVKKNSTTAKDKVHALLWAKDITFYKNGKVVAKVAEKDGMSVEMFDEKYLNTGIFSKTANDEDDTETEPTWAMDISKKYVRENSTLATAVCSDNYARGFNFQTFTKVIHLDRGKGFDSELLKQRTARAYRGGQAEQVQEVFIDATFTEDSTTESSVSDSANFKLDLENALSLEKKNLEEGKEYQEWVWDEDEWVELGSPWTYTTEEDELLTTKLNQIFYTSGYVKPVCGDDGENIRRIVLLKGTDIKDVSKVKSDWDMLSIDQIKSLVNEADQDFFQDIIYNGLKSDLTARIDARRSDSGVAIKTPAMMRYVLDPTPENLSRAEKELEDFDANPCSHISYDPSRYDTSDLWLTNQIEYNSASDRLTEHQKSLLDLVGGPSILDYHLGDGKISLGSNSIGLGRSRFSKSARITIYRDYIENDIVKLTNCAPRGYASKFLFAEIITAKKLGKKFIQCYAAGSSGNSTYSGYAVWPKFGFNTQINVDGLLRSVPSDSGNQVYVKAVRQILGENAGKIDLQKLLVISADIVTNRIDKKDAKKYKKEMERWKEAKSQAIGEKPDTTNAERWLPGDRVRADSSFIQSYASRYYMKEGTLVRTDGNRIWVLIDGEDSPIQGAKEYVSLLTTYPTATEEDVRVWRQRKEDWIKANPEPEKPKKKSTVEERVAVGEKLWALYGSSTTMRLDLTDGSTSMRIANAYLKKKALEKNVEVQDYLNSPTDLFNIEDPWCWGQEIDKVKVAGQLLNWKDVVKQYPEAFRTAWYAHNLLRVKVRSLCGTEKEYESFMKKYRLVDPQTTHDTPSPEARALQSRTKGLTVNESKSYDFENPDVRMKLANDIEQEISDKKLWVESQDPCIQAVWEQLRLENYVGQIVSEIIESDEDPDLIEAQRAKVK